jgi:NAD+ diphosphatase
MCVVFIRSSVMMEKLDETSLMFCIKDGLLLIHKDKSKNSLPSFREITELTGNRTNWLYLGERHGIPCCCIGVDEGMIVPDTFEFCDIRQLYSVLEFEVWQLAGYARQIVDWDRNFTYCGRCGRETSYMKDERAKVCDACGLINYPRISPAIIVAVVRDGKILLAQGTRFRLPFYSVLAGFVEPGENLEECIVREVREEAGIEIENIRYFSSQPWPFPDSLMIAFFADYKSGEITIDPIELIDAGWFTPDNLPDIPPEGSVARKMIHEFIRKYKKE